MTKHETVQNQSAGLTASILDGGTDPAERPPQSPGQLMKDSRHGLLMSVHHVCNGWLSGAD